MVVKADQGNAKQCEAQGREAQTATGRVQRPTRVAMHQLHL